MSLLTTSLIEFNDVLYLSITIAEGLTSLMDVKTTVIANFNAILGCPFFLSCYTTYKIQAPPSHLDLEQVHHKEVDCSNLS